MKNNFFKLFSSLCLLLFFSKAHSQVATYQFLQTMGTYTEINGGTVHGTSTNDDQRFSNLPIGFDFIFGGQTYTHYSLNTNGFLQLGATVVQTSNYAISSTSTTQVISPLGIDLKGKASGSQLMSLVSGTTPNRVLTIQWKNYKFFTATDAECTLNFQVKLYENNHKIEFIYGAFSQTSTARNCEIGIKGASTSDYSNRTTSDWITINAGSTPNATCLVSSTVKPANGQILSWSPPSNDPPSAATLISPLNNSIDVLPNTPLQWSAGGGVVEGYKLLFGTNNPPTHEYDLGLVSTTNPQINFDSTYYWMIKPYNTHGTQNNVPVWTFNTIQKIGLPYYQNFDNVTTPQLPIGFNKIATHPSSPSSVGVYTSDLNSTNMYPYSASQYAVLKTSNTPSTESVIMLILPPTDTSLHLTRVRFHSKLIANGAMNISVGAIIDPRDVNTFTSVQDFNLTAQYQQYTANLSTYVGSAKYVAIKVNTLNFANAMVLIDDIIFEKIPTEAACVITPSPFDFGNIETYTSSQSQAFTIKNGGIGDLVINALSDIQISGTDATKFHLTVPTNTVFPLTLAADSSITVQIRFSPTSLGVNVANLVVNSNVTQATASLSGNGIQGFVINSFPYLESFELNNGHFRAEAISGTNQWEWGVPNKATHMQSAYSGSKAWVTKLTPELPNGHNPLYDHNSNSCLYLPRIDFSNIDNPKIAVRLFIRTDKNAQNEFGNDAMILESSTDGGLNWVKFEGSPNFYNYHGTEGGLPSPKWAGQHTSWLYFSSPLTGLENQSNVLLRFRFVSDNNGFREEGIGIDNLMLFDANTPPTHLVKFVVTDGTSPVENAQISIAGQSIINSNTNGIATINLSLGSYTYGVEKQGFETLTGQYLDVIDDTVTVNVVLTPISIINYELTYSVNGGNGSLEAKVDNILINSGTMVEANKDVEFLAIPNSGYRVKEWTKNSLLITGNTSTVYTLLSINENTNVTVTFELEPSTSIEKWESSLIKVYPNPASDFLIIDSDKEGKLEIIDIKGKTILETNLIKGKSSIDIKGFAKGVYVVRFICNDNSTKQKLIIE